MSLKLIKQSIQSSIQTYKMMADDSATCSTTDPTESMRQWEAGRAAAYEQAISTLENKLYLIDQLIDIQEGHTDA